MRFSLLAVLLLAALADFACAQNFGYTPDRAESERYVKILRERRAQRALNETEEKFLAAHEEFLTRVDYDRRRTLAVGTLFAGGALLAIIVATTILAQILPAWIENREHAYTRGKGFPFGLAAIAVALMMLASALAACAVDEFLCLA